MAADMLVAYYSKGCNSKEVFAGLKVSQENRDNSVPNRGEAERLELYEANLNCHNVVRFDVQRFLFDESHVHIFLRGLFKGSEYVELAYMTGILPIKKYGEHSAINLFDEYSVTDTKNFGEYFGFTKKEVQEQCKKYNVDFAEMKKWYDGYRLGDFHIYNPKSVVDALTWKKFKSYWTGTETYEALKVYIERNFDGLREAVIEMLGGGQYKIDPTTFQNDMTTFECIIEKFDVSSMC